jgi:ABC-2 type transport system ATP-binding protein
MDSAVELLSVSKVFRHRPVLFNWLGKERGGTTCALQDVSFAARAGSVLALLGPNGSGKTTILKLISTILLPNQGRVLVGGYDVEREGNAVRRRVGFAVANERSFFNRLTARENLEFFATLEEIPRKQRGQRVDELLVATGLENAADTLVMKFSTGMYQKLGVGRALLKRPEVLLLDEPSRSLDPGATTHLWSLVRQAAAGGSCVLMATHNFEEAAQVAGEVIIMKDGRCVAQQKIGGGLSVAELRRTYFRHVPAAAEPLLAAVQGGRA